MRAAPGARRGDGRGEGEVVAVWDRAVRLTHWAVVALFALMWWTGKTGRMDLHKLAGYALLALVLFRLIWGVVGSSTARFSSFVRGPVAVARYAAGLVTGRVRTVVIGHNPMGGWSVVALLTGLTLSLATGLFAEDTDGLESGPLASRASYAVTSAAATWHGRLFDALLVLAGLHLAAIVFYAVVKRDDLVSPMLRGVRSAPAGAAPMRPAGAGRLLVSAAVAVAVAAWIAVGLKPL